MKRAMTILLICAFCASATAWADCVYNGKTLCDWQQGRWTDLPGRWELAVGKA